MKRRHFIKVLGVITLTTSKLFSKVSDSITHSFSNFRFVYLNEKLRKIFLGFLENVFTLYPSDKLHELIYSVSKLKLTDKDIYINVQSKLDTISPIFSTIRYALPALKKQKEIMAYQTAMLLGLGNKYHGYLEIGSLGRYLDILEDKVVITGNRYYADGKKPGYSITDIIDRGQISKGADYIPFTDYQTDYSEHIEHESLDLVTIYIGFHHCPINLRTQFISSIHKVIRANGKLILRDHDCDTNTQKTLVALAHDVFNMGTGETWEYNSKEIRNFYSLNFIVEFIENIGFRYEGKKLYQKGDPTKNVLMMFTKI
jgi:SAM-dependent methyltransferase